jgi:hypothetical protein
MILKGEQVNSVHRRKQPALASRCPRNWQVPKKVPENLSSKIDLPRYDHITSLENQPDIVGALIFLQWQGSCYIIKPFDWKAYWRHSRIQCSAA